MEKEIWKNIPLWEGYYQASTLGRIKSCDRKVTWNTGVVRLVKGKILKLQKGSKYLHVGLGRGGRLKTITVHSLVANTFLEKPKWATMVMHGNNIKTDNRVLNLKWGTALQNMRDAFADDLVHTPFGWQRPNRVHGEDTYKKVYTMYNSGQYNKHQISVIVGIHSGTVHRMVTTYLKNTDKINKLLNL